MRTAASRTLTVGMVTLLSIALASAASSPPQDKSTQAKHKSVPREGSPYGKQQALFDRLNVEEAWKITKGNPAILIGVIDNGFDFFHPDLKGQLMPGYYYSGGYHTEFYEGIAHGTMVASILVARDDHLGMVGLAPDCRVLTASQGMLEHKLLQMQKKFFDEHPKADIKEFQKEMMKHQDVLAKFGRDWAIYQVSGAAEAIRYLVDHGVKVINISGGLKRSLCPSAETWTQLEEAFAYAAGKGVVIVLGAGNNAAQWEDYPGRPDTVIIAGAAMLDDTRWEGEVEFKGMKVKQGSNFGNRLTAMAPIENILTCQPHEKRVYQTSDSPMGPTQVEFKGPYEVLPNGATSSAAPIVSALVALIFSADPQLDAKSAVEIVKRGCDDIGEQGYDIHTGYGRVNFGRSVKLARTWSGSTDLKSTSEKSASISR